MYLGLYPHVLRCFNEAPAKRGGNTKLKDKSAIHANVASMRPPRNAGEYMPYCRHMSGLVGLQ